MSRNILQGLIGAWCPTLGPSGYTLLDRSGRGQHGTLTNMDAGTDWVGTPGGWALDYDGTNDYISIPNRLSYTSGQWLSVSAWFRRNVTSAYHEIINKFNGTSAANEDGWLVRVTNGNKLLFTIGQSGSYGQFESTATYSDTAWHHIMVSLCVGAGSTLKMYYDGAEVALSSSGTVNAVPDSDATAYAINIGAQRYAGVSYRLLNGQVGDCAVWHAPKTAVDARQLYQLGQPGLGRLLTPQRRSYAFRVPAAAVKSYLFVNRGQVIGGGTL